MSTPEIASQWLNQLLQLMGYPSSVTLDSSGGNHNLEEGKSCWLTIDRTNLTTEQIQALVGMDGANIDAIQYIANLTLNAQLPSESVHCFYTVELDEYRTQRQLELQKIAEQAAAQVRDTQTEYEIKNLSAADRRQVHMLFEQYPDLETFSQGKEPNRNLIVRLLVVP